MVELHSNVAHMRKMPAKKQVTKEMILGAALRVLMEGGTEAVNVKSLAAELGCSTQPIYLSFDNMDALRKELIPTAVNKFVELMQKECGSTRVHLYGIEYICLARQQPELFRFLFMRSQAFAEMKQVLLPIIDRTIDELMEQYHLDRAAADELHDQLWMHTHGIAAMIATDYCDWDMSKAQRMLNRCQKALVREYEA